MNSKELAISRLTQFSNVLYFKYEIKNRVVFDSQIDYFLLDLVAKENQFTDEIKQLIIDFNSEFSNSIPIYVLMINWIGLEISLDGIVIIDNTDLTVSELNTLIQFNKTRIVTRSGESFSSRHITNRPRRFPTDNPSFGRLHHNISDVAVYPFVPLDSFENNDERKTVEIIMDNYGQFTLGSISESTRIISTFNKLYKKHHKVEDHENH